MGESEARAAAIVHVNQLAELHGGSVPRSELMKPMASPDGPVKIIHHMRGIHRPAGWTHVLSLISAGMDGGVARYGDQYDSGDAIYHYAFQDAQDQSNLRAAGNAAARNDLLRQAHDLELGLIMYLRVPGDAYIPVAPVVVAEVDEARRSFVIDMAPDPALITPSLPVLAGEGAPRRYRVQLVQDRVDRDAFRASVLRAYGTRCAVCSLVHDRLLEAAHITQHARGGLQTVPNGMALCRLHHGAFDNYMLGITPDLVVEIRSDVLAIEDGPVHQSGLVDIHGQRLRVVPSRSDEQPNREALATRYEEFRAA